MTKKKSKPVKPVETGKQKKTHITLFDCLNDKTTTLGGGSPGKKTKRAPKKTSKVKPTAKTTAKAKATKKGKPTKGAKPVVTSPVPEEQKPSNITPLHPDIPLEAFIYMEGRDNEQLDKELRGMEPGELCYAFRTKKNKKDKSGNFCKDTYGKLVKEEFGPVIADLSVSGYKKCRLELGGIKFSTETMVVDKEQAGIIVIYVEGIDLKTSSTIIGAGSAELMMKRGNGVSPDPFAHQKALSKAQRNATRGLVDQDIINAIVQAYLLANCTKDGQRQWPVWSYPEAIRGDVEEARNGKKQGATKQSAGPSKPTIAEQDGNEASDKAQGSTAQGSPEWWSSPITEPKRRSLFLFLTKVGYTHDQLKEYLDLAYGLDSTKKVTNRQYSEVKELIEDHQLLIQIDRHKDKNGKANNNRAKAS